MLLSRCLRLVSSAPGTPCVLHSFPTRRSSDLSGWRASGSSCLFSEPSVVGDRVAVVGHGGAADHVVDEAVLQGLLRGEPRSEEHTSELQSPCNLVCRLLLEKKNKHAHVQAGTW